MSTEDKTLFDHLTRLISTLEKAEIDYALCGGLALAVHGHPRFTQDIDLLVEPETVDELMETVRSLGFTIPADVMRLNTHLGELEIRRISAASGTKLVTLDLLAVNSATRFAWDSRRAYDWRGGTLRCVSRQGLAHLKRISDRPQDRVDLRVLGLDDDNNK